MSLPKWHGIFSLSFVLWLIISGDLAALSPKKLRLLLIWILAIQSGLGLRKSNDSMDPIMLRYVDSRKEIVGLIKGRFRLILK